MIEQQVTVTVTKAALTTVADCTDLLEWSRTIPGVAVAVSARTDGEIVVQAEGPAIDTVQARLGQTLVWDGTRFTVEDNQ